ncbi:MAG TPA: DUF3365 domain-containing protein [Nitrospirae bacterium]|nr:DUF3365 domain-containing protein [Nitrospirota bacterium]
MFRNMRLRTRFTLIMLIVYLFSLPVIVLGSYYILKNNAFREISQEAKLMLAAWEGAGAYTSNVLRPLLEKKCGDISTPEMVKGLFIAREVEASIKKVAGNYSYKVAAINPFNKNHIPDSFEESKLKEFRQGKLKGQWKGFKKTKEGEFYVVMKPLKVSFDCLRCHGDPMFAPKEIRKRYGTKGGFNWQEGEIAAIRMVYVPTAIPIANAKKTLVFFSLIYSGFFFLVIMIINILINRSIIKPIESFVTTAEDISRGKMDRDFDIKTNDEMRALADAFTRMKLSLAKAMDILRER